MNIEHLIVSNLAWFKSKALQFCKNEDDANDLAGETIEKILRCREKFDFQKDFRPWATTVMRNTYITQYNRCKCVPFVNMEDDYTYASPYFAHQELEVSRILSKVRECARKSVAIECVILYAKGYTYDEISMMLGIPIGTVMSRISNGRKMLRDALDIPKRK